MVGVVFAIAIAFVYNGPQDEMQRDLDAVGLGTIAPEGSEGILVDRCADLQIGPLSWLGSEPLRGCRIEGIDQAGMLEVGYAQVARDPHGERVLIATGFDEAVLARFRARADRDHVRVLAGPPVLAHDVLVPRRAVIHSPRCSGWRTRWFEHRHHRTWPRWPAALALLLVAAGLARVAARPRAL